MSDTSTSLAEPAAAQGQGEGYAKDAHEASAQPLDFAQPTKFTPELRRQIAHAFESFCNAAPARVVDELRAPIGMRTVSARQLSFSAARAALPEDPLLLALSVRPTGGRMLLALEHSFIHRALGCLLGGSAADDPQERELSEIDRALARRLLASLLASLSEAWRELGVLELAVDAEGADLDIAAFAPAAEPTLVTMLECLLGESPSQLSLLIPWSAVEPIAGAAVDSSSTAAAGDPQQVTALRRGLADARMVVRAEIGATRLPVERVLAIAPGSLLALDAKADDGVRLLADRVALACGSPGRSGSRRAVKLTSAIEPRADPDAPPMGGPSRAAGAASDGGAETLRERLSQMRGVDLRVWAELGRAELPLGKALRLPVGAVLELDHAAEDPISVYAGGVRVASGSLLVTGDGEWAVKVSSVT